MNRKVKLLGAFIVTGVWIVAVAVAVAATSPSVTTGTTSAVHSTSAVLHGSVNPNGASTSYQFQWGLTTGYGLSSPVGSAGGGTKAVSVQRTATGLIPGTVYHYRLIAQNRYGISVGADRTFKTAGHPPPGVATGPVAQLSSNSATLSGIINPHGEKTTWWFQYGITPFYGSQTFVGVVPAGSAIVAVTQQIQGLAPATVFHYRLVAVHGTSVAQYGNDATFMTYPSPRPVPHVSAGTKPRRDRSRPFVFTTTGHISRPSFIPPGLACSSNVTIKYFLGRRQVAFTLVPIQPNCTFAGQVAFGHKPGRGRRQRQVHLRVLIHFRGSGYVAPADARAESVTLG